MKILQKSIRVWISMLMLIFCVNVLSGCTQQPTTTAEEQKTENTSQSAGILKVHFIDVGQGDCVLLESDGHFMLIDAGENNKGNLVVEYLRQQKVETLDYVIGTHPHSDHIGGLDTVIQNFTIKNVLLPEKEHTTKTYEDVIDILLEKKLSATAPVVGERYILGNASFVIIAPNKDYGDDLNNWSIGVKVINGDNSFLFTGDAETQAEEDMLTNGIDLTADVLKAGHHGSSTSTSDHFLETVHPSYVVISCGDGNDYGHPHKETMDKLKQAATQIFRTDQQGTIIAVSDGTTIQWNQDTVPQNLQETAQGYILNTKTNKFHYEWCSSAKDISQENREEYQGAREQLIDMGYEPCKKCNP